ncbi:MAG: PaaI family thioesterase [Paraperlucidibaca sp.]
MKMTAVEVDQFISAGLPAYAESGCVVAAVTSESTTVRLRYRDDQLRPGGSLSGPTMMALADTAMYAIILATLGPVALAVTQNFNINFLQKPAPADLIAEARFLRLGRRAAVIDVHIRSSTDDSLVAQATGTYALPSVTGAGV